MDDDPPPPEHGAGAPEERGGPVDPQSGRADPDAERDSLDPKLWPSEWPRIYPELGTQWARFFGGSADGLRDVVKEIALGELPTRVETMGSTYRLVKVEDREAEYHVQEGGEQ